MSNSRRKQENRIRTAHDERYQTPVYRADFVPPSAGIFDAPLRYYKANKEWAAFIEGAVSNLTELYAWRDAQDESYPAITSICEFLIGMAESELTLSCEDVADCIESNLTVQIAIQNYIENNFNIQQNGTNDTGGNNPPVYEQNPILVNECDNDRLFAMVTQLVDYIHGKIQDFFQQIESNTNRVERVEAVLETVPLTSVLPFDEILEWVDQALENYSQTFDAEYTLALRDTYRCELFCLAQNNNCQLSFRDMADFFLARAGQSVTSANFADAVDYFFFGTLPTNLVVDGTHGLFALVLAYNGAWLGVDDSRLASLIAAFSNDSDPDWSLLCDCVNVWTYEIVFANGLDQATIENGELVAGGIAARFSANPLQNGTGSQRQLSVLIDFAFVANITEIRMTYDRTLGNATFGASTIIGNSDYTNTFRSGGYVQGTDLELLMDDVISTDSIGLFVRSSTDNSGNALLKSVVISGTGNNPFE